MRRARKDGLRRVKAGRPVVAEASWFDYVIPAAGSSLPTSAFTFTPYSSPHNANPSRCVSVGLQCTQVLVVEPYFSMCSFRDVSFIRQTIVSRPTVRVPVSAGLEALAGRSRIGDVAGTFMCS